MNRFSLTCLSDSALIRDLKSLVVQDRATTALLIAHLGEVDSRRLYSDAGYPSMFEYCVRELRFSDQSAFKRIRVARLARQFPSIYGMLADGRLHPSAIVVLSAYMTTANGDELLAAAAGRSKGEIEQLLAKRFPQPDLPTLIMPVGGPAASTGVAPSAAALQLSPGRVGTAEAATSAASLPPQKVAPLAPERYAIQCTVGQSTYEKLEYAKALLGHSVPNGQLDQVLDRALDTLIAHLERQKFARTDRPRPCRPSDDARHLPADVKRAVWQRDGGQCTFVAVSGRRCDCRTRLEFDHVEPVANGGPATPRNVRLRCQAHNQHAAERAFGRRFMSTKRETGSKQQLPEHVAELMPWLRTLGLRAEEARHWAECCSDMPDASLEERLRHALRSFGGPARRVSRASAA